MSIRKISRIRTGGQTGVDRAAMDAAREYGIPLCGWCPRNGWAEDYPSAPGLLKDYPELSETPSEGTVQRTEWNMRDADAILTIIPSGSLSSPGTDVGLTAGEMLNKPMLTVSGIDDISGILAWLNSLPNGIELCVGGPRASECSRAYEIAREILSAVFEAYIENDHLKLVRPVSKYAEQVMQYREEMLASKDSFDGCAGLEEVESFDDWIEFDSRLRKKYGEGYVPSEVFLAVRMKDDKVVGIIDYRHPLSPFLLKYGGNIGYSILPSERRKGYAGKMLRLLLPVCKEYGEKKVLLTCDKDNDASRETIINNGGMLENEIVDDVGLSQCGTIQRYWITL